MPNITRRVFIAGGASAAINLGAFAETSGSAQLDDALRSGFARRKIPAVVGAVASKSKTLYTGAFGTRDSSGVPVRTDSIFQTASMTKAITTTAALQLVDQGKVDLSEPIAKHLPQLANLEVLEGFDAAGKPSLRPARTPITLRHLLTHTSGFCYDIWHEQMFRYTSAKRPTPSGKPGPLMFEPGTRWQYGESVDWAGRLVETISGATLEDYFQDKILRPLGMNDTSYILPETKFVRLVSNYQRDLAARTRFPDQHRSVFGWPIRRQRSLGRPLFNTFYWMDPHRDRCAVLMMQYLPFVDKEAVGLLDEFEKSVYRNL